MEKQVYINQEAEVYLTKSGLLVVKAQECNTPFYCSNDGQFRRYASIFEANPEVMPRVMFGSASFAVTWITLPYTIPEGAIKVYTAFQGRTGQYTVSNIAENTIDICVEDVQDEENCYAVWARYPYSEEMYDKLEADGFYLIA